ncbi:MAG TPA: type II secretion system protein [Candidatus Omnitrophota bacterium]|nr:type II secretion system protein [Candidatus Omnitrophota bacterium]HPD83999.1 type II secretion system protein [Candidatus Omnitrophota bacterium]HRZ02856.1 type II secretion system protein [Candidatus Omnitrophota bacterium]
MIRAKKGFTLVESMVAVSILIFVLVSILFSYVACLSLSEISKNASIAMRAAKTRFEQIRNTPFDQIKATYNNVTFTTPGLHGIGVSYVDDSNQDLLRVTVTFCWQQPNGLLIGEDVNLNGQLDIGEDKNGNGIVDSPAELASYIFDR